MVSPVDEARGGKEVRRRHCGKAIRVPLDKTGPGKTRDDSPDEASDWVLPAHGVASKPPVPGPRPRARRSDREEDRPRRRPAAGPPEDDEDRPRRRNPAGGGLALPLGIGCGVAVVAVFAVGAALLLAFLGRQARTGDLQARAQDLPRQAAVPPGPVPLQIDPATVARVKDATVYLRVQLPNGDVAQGSGFFCLEPGLILTNAHVLGMLRADAAPPTRVAVVVHSGEADSLQLTGSVLGVDRDNDLAVLRVPGDATRLPPPLPVATATRLTETQKVYIFGFPLGTQLGKNITVSESSVSSLRRDDAGGLCQVQVNGGMHPGNSGGPVTDARGAVVGVSVAAIRGTQINFAIPGDFVHQLFAGQFAGTELRTPYLANGRPALPVQVTCLDPLRRVREVKVEVWAGRPGEERPASRQGQRPLPGDGPRQAYPLTFRNGTYTVDVPLLPLPPGQVYWLQPFLVNAAGAPVWDTAISTPANPPIVLERVAAAIRFNAPTAPVERSVRLKRSVTANLYRGDENAVVLTTRTEADVLESLQPDGRGLGTFIRLTIGKSSHVRESPGKKLVPPPQAHAFLSQYSPTYLVDASNACKERGKRNFAILAPAYRDQVEGMYEAVCNTFEAATLPVPNRVVRPLESWRVGVPMLVRVEGKRQVHDLHLTCTYEGARSAVGRREAFLALSGVVKGRGPNAEDVLGTVKGHALLDVDKGFVTLVELAVDSEIEVEERGLRILVRHQSFLTRSEGNSLGITPAKVNQPGAK
jgi:S1-C subfamily serine protease